MNSANPWTVQSLDVGFHGYPDWSTFAVRDAHNHCIAVVGQIDRATTLNNEANAKLMRSAPELRQLCESGQAWLEAAAILAPEHLKEGFVRNAKAFREAFSKLNL